MKIVISPAKSLDFESELPTKKFTNPVFVDEIAKINKTLRQQSPKQLSKLMAISDKLSELNWQRNQDFQQPFTKENARPAVYSFNGDVYVGLDAASIPEQKIDVLQDSLRILSGLYGTLKPLDLIQPYRLEMGTKIKIGKDKNLYEFWKQKVTKQLNDELQDDELFINLASNEYFKAIDKKTLKVPVITPLFKDWKNDKLKTISFFAKKARGMMVRYIIDENVQTIEELKSFDYDGYHFSEEYTNKTNEFVFVR